MLMSEIVEQISSKLGQPANRNVEEVSIEKMVLIAFQELKAYIGTPVNKTIPFSTRIDLIKCGVSTTRVLYVYPATPKMGMNLTSVDLSNPFALAATAGTYSGTGNMDAIVLQVVRAQLSNTLSTDFQWSYDLDNQVVYCTCKSPTPTHVTIRYVPNYTDVSELQNPVWINYLIRMGEANAKIALGRSRSKYKVEGSNVSYDGEILLQEGTAELEAIRTELKPKKRKMRVLR